MSSAETSTKMTVNKKISAPEVKTCGNCCGVEGSAGVAKLSACARCGLVVYCSKDCQRSDWKDNHKKCCIAKADRVPQPRAPLADCKEAASEGEDCPICLEPVALASATTLPCDHMFHAACVADLRKFKLKKVCPLCRTPLPPGPDKLHEEATLRYMVVERRVERGKASWGALTKDEQREMHDAVDGWRAAAAQGHSEAQVHLGHMSYQGRGMAQSDVEAARWWQKAADQGHAQAQHNLGTMFDQGRGVAQSDVEAARCWQKAADQGIAEAQNKLGHMSYQGRGVAQSDVEATRWWQKAADQGHAQAQHNLGNMFYQGRGVAQRYVKAARWYRKGADQGLAEAQFALGTMFYQGRGVTHSDVEAARWYRKAADQGNAQAQFVLGAMFSEGCGVPQSDVEATRWYRKAADQGHVQAQHKLGNMLAV
jgi:TPR repeat protein